MREWAVAGDSASLATGAWIAGLLRPATRRFEVCTLASPWRIGANMCVDAVDSWSRRRGSSWSTFEVLNSGKHPLWTGGQSACQNRCPSIRCGSRATHSFALSHCAGMAAPPALYLYLGHAPSSRSLIDRICGFGLWPEMCLLIWPGLGSSPLNERIGERKRRCAPKCVPLSRVHVHNSSNKRGLWGCHNARPRRSQQNHRVACHGRAAPAHLWFNLRSFRNPGTINYHRNLGARVLTSGGRRSGVTTMLAFVAGGGSGRCPNPCSRIGTIAARGSSLFRNVALKR